MLKKSDNFSYFGNYVYQFEIILKGVTFPN